MKIAVVGGGAAGLMATATILEANPTAEVLLIEKNDGLGKKVIISGGGRCNVTTGITDVRMLLTRYPRGGKFLSSAMYSFPPNQVYDWFETQGVPLKTEEDLRVFPQSDNGKDIVGVFEKLFQHSAVHVLLKANVVRVEKREDQFALTIKGEDQPVVVDRLVLTTGGQAYRQTGSTGDGYAFAQALGHTITSLAPSLNAFFTEETWPKELAGLSFPRVTITAYREKIQSYTGPCLFTHKGITGPAVFALSSLVAFEPYDAKNPLSIAINLFPEKTAIELQGELDQLIEEHSRKSVENVLGYLVPKSFASVLCTLCNLSPNKHAAELTRQERLSVIARLMAVPLTVVARGAGDEFVTAGGVDLKEVNPSTMESKLCPGLFFAGEILDIDGFTGGFNLQASWATGRLAGSNVVN